MAICVVFPCVVTTIRNCIIFKLWSSIYSISNKFKKIIIIIKKKNKKQKTPLPFVLQLPLTYCAVLIHCSGVQISNYMVQTIFSIWESAEGLFIPIEKGLFASCWWVDQREFQELGYLVSVVYPAFPLSVIVCQYGSVKWTKVFSLSQSLFLSTNARFMSSIGVSLSLRLRNHLYWASIGKPRR